MNALIQTQLAEIKTNGCLTARVFVTSYGLGNRSGFGYGKWFDLAEYASATDFLDDATEYLLSLGDADPELCLSDFGDLHPALYFESPSREEIDNMIEYANLDVDLRRHFTNGIEIDGKSQLTWRTPLEIAEAYSETFRGEYDSIADFARDLAHEAGELDGLHADIIHAIDWEVVANNRFSDYNVANGYVYSPEY